MNALMLVFLLSAAGEVGTFAVKFDSLEKCEAARYEAVQRINKERSPSGAPITHFALACVVPAQVETI